MVSESSFATFAEENGIVITYDSIPAFPCVETGKQ
jgi:hypothetical protein